MKKSMIVTVAPQPAVVYPIRIGTKLLMSPSSWLAPQFKNVVVITDNTIKKKYGAPLIDALNRAGHHTLLLSFAAGEKSKNYQTKYRLEQKILQRSFARDTLIIALGGGVVGDLAGFIAATYMRGVPYIQVPTTLLAMVDSSIGGKTSIDMPQGKNLIGAFWQPRAVIADLDCLQSLPTQHIINGFIEALKMFLTSDAISFNFFIKKMHLVLNKDAKALNQLIFRAIKIKKNIIEHDEREDNLRMILNFGHTIGHALEKITQYSMLHGVAVGHGMLVEAKIAQTLGILPADQYELIREVLQQLGITPAFLKKYSVAKIIRYTQSDKKVKTGKVYYVLIEKIGKVYENHLRYAHNVDDSVVRKAWLAVIRGQ